MHRRDDGQPGVQPQRVDQLEHLLLAARVERARRLVEQEQRRLLRERPREHRPLALAAGERARAARPASSAEVEPHERRLGGGVVAPALAAGVRDVRRPAEQHVLRDGHPGGHQRRLRDERDPPRDLAPAQRAHRIAVRARSRRGSGRARRPPAAGVVLPAPFGPIRVTHSPALDRERHAVDDVPAAELDRHPLERERAS